MQTSGFGVAAWKCLSCNQYFSCRKSDIGRKSICLAWMTDRFVIPLGLRFLPAGKNHHYIKINKPGQRKCIPKKIHIFDYLKNFAQIFLNKTSKPLLWGFWFKHNNIIIRFHYFTLFVDTLNRKIPLQSSNLFYLAMIWYVSNTYTVLFKICLWR